MSRAASGFQSVVDVAKALALILGSRSPTGTSGGLSTNDASNSLTSFARSVARSVISLSTLSQSGSSRRRNRIGESAWRGSWRTKTLALPIGSGDDVLARRPMSCTIGLSDLCASWNAPTFRVGRSNPSPSMSTQTITRLVRARIASSVSALRRADIES